MPHLNLVLRAIKPEINVNRVYQIRVDQGLFNSWVVITAYGRYGGGAHQKIHSFYTLQDARNFVSKTLKKRFKAEKRIGCNYDLVNKSYSDDFIKDCVGSIPL